VDSLPRIQIRGDDFNTMSSPGALRIVYIYRRKLLERANVVLSVRDRPELVASWVASDGVAILPLDASLGADGGSVWLINFGGSERAMFTSSTSLRYGRLGAPDCALLSLSVPPTMAGSFLACAYYANGCSAAQRARALRFALCNIAP
jgi:hypothetical protein